MTNQNEFKYINSFDGLRGIAVISVMMLHGANRYVKGGWIGVDLFFVLSGFLITSLLQSEYLKTGTLSFSKFYIRRFLRLFPALVVCIILSNILWSYTNILHDADRAWATTSALFYFTNFIKGSVSGNLAHLWSLSVEEHFYFFWPLLSLLVFFVIPVHRRILLLILIFLLVVVFRIYVFHHQPQFTSRIFTIDSNRFTLCKIDSIMLGAMLVFLINDTGQHNVVKTLKMGTPVLITLLSIFAAIVIFLDEDNLFWRNGGFILTDLLCVLLVVTAIGNPLHPLLTGWFISWFGKRSYGLYCYHIPIFLAISSAKENSGLSGVAMVFIERFGLSIALAGLSYQYLEQPVLKLKRKYEVQNISSESA